MVTKIKWQSTDRVSQALVEPMLDDEMGVDDAEVREATLKWALRIVKDEAYSLGLTMGELNSMAWHFADGYAQALVDMGKRKPDGTNTFKD
jgi:hypothetical protein